MSIIKVDYGELFEGGAKNSYLLITNTYMDGDYRSLWFHSTKDEIGYDYYPQSGSGLNYSDDNVSIVNTGNYTYTITFNKAGTLIYSINKTEVHYTAGQSYNVLANNHATNPYLIIMD